MKKCFYSTQQATYCIDYYAGSCCLLPYSRCFLRDKELGITEVDINDDLIIVENDDMQDICHNQKEVKCTITMHTALCKDSSAPSEHTVKGYIMSSKNRSNAAIVSTVVEPVVEVPAVEVTEVPAVVEVPRVAACDAETAIVLGIVGISDSKQIKKEIARLASAAEMMRREKDEPRAIRYESGISYLEDLQASKGKTSKKGEALFAELTSLVVKAEDGTYTLEPNRIYVTDDKLNLYIFKKPENDKGHTVCQESFDPAGIKSGPTERKVAFRISGDRSKKVVIAEEKPEEKKEQAA
jgi:hypothetical protein